MNGNLEIKVSAKDVYDSLKRVEGKVEELIEHQKETDGKVKCNKREIAKLHTFKTRALTIWAGIVTVGTIIGNTILNHLIN